MIMHGLFHIVLINKRASSTLKQLFIKIWNGSEGFLVFRVHFFVFIVWITPNILGCSFHHVSGVRCHHFPLLLIKLWGLILEIGMLRHGHVSIYVQLVDLTLHS